MLRDPSKLPTSFVKRYTALKNFFANDSCAAKLLSEHDKKFNFTGLEINSKLKLTSSLFKTTRTTKIGFTFTGKEIKANGEKDQVVKFLTITNSQPEMSFQEILCKKTQSKRVKATERFLLFYYLMAYKKEVYDLLLGIKFANAEKPEVSYKFVMEGNIIRELGSNSIPGDQPPTVFNATSNQESGGSAQYSNMLVFHIATTPGGSQATDEVSDKDLQLLDEYLYNQHTAEQMSSTYVQPAYVEPVYSASSSYLHSQLWSNNFRTPVSFNAEEIEELERNIFGN